jgi:hypothetical protein
MRAIKLFALLALLFLWIVPAGGQDLGGGINACTNVGDVGITEPCSGSSPFVGPPVYTGAISDSDGDPVVTTGINTSGANLIVVAESWYNPEGQPTLTDSKNNTWTQIGSTQTDSTCSVALYYSYAPTVGAGHTFTLTGSNYDTIQVEAWATAGASPLDQVSGAGASQPGSVTPSQNNELITVAGCTGSSAVTPSINQSFTITNAYDRNADSMGGGLAYIVQTTKGAVNPTWGTFDASIIATFKP